MSRVVYMPYEEASQLIPILQELKRRAPNREVKESADRILLELSFVKKDVEYVPSGGCQLFLKEIDYAFLNDVRETFGI